MAIYAYLSSSNLLRCLYKSNVRNARDLIQTVVCKHIPVPCSNEKDFYGKSDLAPLSPRRDLNSRPLVYKTSALTPELRRLTELCILH